MIAAETGDGAGSHAEEDENYFISMTDMMVGILFIFIIMLMVFALNFQKKADQSDVLTQQQKEQIQKSQELAQQISELQIKIDQEIDKINKADLARSELLETIKKELKKAGMNVDVSDKNGVLRLGEDAIQFGSDDASLDKTATANVDKLSSVLNKVLPNYTVSAQGAPASSGYVIDTIFIEGHTDRTGQDSRNWQLSTERAVNTYRRIVDSFPGLRALRNSAGSEILSVSGYAYTRPVSDREDSVGRHQNRRIDLRFVMEADSEAHLTEIKDLLEKMKKQVGELQESAKAGLTAAPTPTSPGKAP